MRIHKHFSWGHKTSLFFVGIQEVSARRVRKELINHNLYLFGGGGGHMDSRSVNTTET